MKKNKSKKTFNIVIILFFFAGVAYFLLSYSGVLDKLFKSDGTFKAYAWKSGFIEHCLKSRLGNNTKCSCIADDMVKKYKNSYGLYDKTDEDLWEILRRWEVRSFNRNRPPKEMQESILICSADN